MELNNLYSRIPFLRIIIPFLLGIIIQLQTKTVSFFGVFAVFVVLLYVFEYLGIYSRFCYRHIFGIFMFIVLFLAGMELTNLNNHSTGTIFDSEMPVTCIAEVHKPPEEKNSTYKCELLIKYVKNDSSNDHCNFKVLGYFEKDSLVEKLKTGDYILMNTKIEKISNNNNPGAFDYKKYLEYRGIRYRSYIESMKWVNTGRRKNGLHAAIADLRSYAEEKIEHHDFDKEAIGLLKALLTGNKSFLDQDIRTTFSNVGAMHVLAISGLHVGIIYLMLGLFFKPLNKSKNGRYFSTTIIIAVLWIYALFTGLSPSVVRAVLMFSMHMIGKMASRNADTLNIITFCAFLILIINPLLLTNTGFQLSYLAVYSILIFYPVLNSLFVIKNMVLYRLWNIVALSLAVQAGIFPIILYHFNQFSTYFILTNILVLPLITAILYMGILLLVLSFIPLLPQLLSWILNVTIDLLMKTVNFIDHLPGAVIGDIYISLVNLIMLYLILISITGLIFIRHIRFLKLALFLVAVSFIFGIYRAKISGVQKYFIVYNIRGHSVINLISGRQNYVICDHELTEKELLYAAKNHWMTLGLKAPQIINPDSTDYSSNEIYIKEGRYIFFNNKRIVLLNSDDIRDVFPLEKLHVDYVILSRNAGIAVKDITRCFVFQELIIDSSNYDYKIQLWEKGITRLNIDAHIVSETGAFIKDFSMLFYQKKVQ